MNEFFRVAAAVPAVDLANPKDNVNNIVSMLGEALEVKVGFVVLPEMCITGYTCADLFHHRTLLDEARAALVELCEATSRGSLSSLTFAVGMPLEVDGQVYNVAAVCAGGRVLAFIPKTYIPNYNEFYEKRWFAAAPSDMRMVSFGDCDVPFGTRVLVDVGGVRVGVEICEDLWTPVPPSSYAALAGADVVVNLSASDALIGKYDYIHSLVKAQSARCVAGYVYASAGFGESSTDLVFDGITIVASNGRMLASGSRWNNDSSLTVADIDIAALRHDRMTMTSFGDTATRLEVPHYLIVNGRLPENNDKTMPKVDPTPFVPATQADIASRCDEIINIQTAGLARRLVATHTKNVVVGISGGLDSTLALLVAVKTFDRLGLDRHGIHGITMPGFGTTDRTHDNAVELMKALGITHREISIVPAVRQHFTDIGHDPEKHDVTYENSQARQRTLLLMDIANQVSGMVLGTGDMSELALGWATYNGDHMSMYGVNAGVPKTLVRYVVAHFADGDARTVHYDDRKHVEAVLRDIVDTPISPELLPADDAGNITQKTEDLVGPYELHDFFLYYTLRYGFTPESIFERACAAFEDRFDPQTIVHWMGEFFRRFFNQQFKRSCMPDGPKVGSVCLSPRGDWRMPSDAQSKAWLARIDAIKQRFS